MGAMRSLRYFSIPVIGAIVCACWYAVAGAQVPTLVPTPGHPALFASAPVVIDGIPVLRITALASPPPGAMPIQSRRFLIDGAIAQLLALDPDRNTTVYDPASFKVGIEREGSEYALVATDARHHAPLPILTVTAEDARHANLTEADLAQQWQSTLQSALIAALERRQPAAIHRSLTVLAATAIGLIVLTIAGLVLFRFLRNRAAAVVVAWGLALLWLAAVTYGLLQFPQSVGYGNAILHGAKLVALVWIVALVAERLLAIAIAQSVRAWALFGIAPGAQARYLLRVPTLSRALVGFSTFLVFFVAALATLSALQIPIASVVTIGGIAALAIGFAAQSLVRDFLNGLLVLFEDQYVVGDYVMIGDYNGMVEHLTLRVVQVRDSRGNLITIPHSTVSQVVNASRSWSRIDYRVTIDSGAEARKALAVLHETLEGLRADPSWHNSVIEPVEWSGIEAMSRNGIELRAVIRTVPLRQFEVRREINVRVLEAFRGAGIALGVDPAAPFVSAPQASPDPT